MSFLPSLAILGLAALAALSIAVSRPSPPELARERAAASAALAIATGLQAIHFAEEAATGFNLRLGPLLGVDAMPSSFFVGFNLSWLGLWIAAVPGVRSGRHWAFFAAWFLAIAGTLNGVAHPLLSLASGGYFPGLLSAPLVGVASLWLGHRLCAATRSSHLARQ